MCREIRHIVVVMSTADVFGALANPVRRRVREILANGLQSAVAMSAHAEHLKVLQQFDQVYWYKSSEDYGKWAAETFQSERATIERVGLLAK